MGTQKEVTKAFQDNVLSVSLDDSHIMAGLENGSVAVVLRRNMHERFVTEPLNDEAQITAVCCDNFDVRGQSLFYAGDSDGFLHVIGENGNLIDSLKVRGTLSLPSRMLRQERCGFSQRMAELLLSSITTSWRSMLRDPLSGACPNMDKSSLSVTGEHLVSRSMSVLILLDS